MSTIQGEDIMIGVGNKTTVACENATSATEKESNNGGTKQQQLCSIKLHHDNGNSGKVTAMTPPPPTTTKTARTLALLIVTLGCCTSIVFLASGIIAAMDDAQVAFETDVDEVALRISSAFREYETAALWIHQSCVSHRATQTLTRSVFRDIYEAVVDNGLPLHAIQFLPNVTREERPYYEEEARHFYNTYYPQIDYGGFSGFVPDVETGGVKLQPLHEEQDFYFPVHYVEPVLDNIGVIDFDVYSEAYPRWAVNTALSTMKPVVTGPLRLIQEFDPNPDIYSVLQFVPGISYSRPYNSVSATAIGDNSDKQHAGGGDSGGGKKHENARDVALIAIRIPSLLDYVAKQDGHIPSMKVYLYDSTPDDPTIEYPLYLGGANILGDSRWKFLGHTELDDLRGERRFETRLVIGLRQWTVAAIANEGTYQAQVTSVILVGVMIFVATLCLGMWVYAKMTAAKIKSQAQQEKARLQIDHARQAASSERELNEILAHEVRNPLAAAMSACSFVTSTIQESIILNKNPSKIQLQQHQEAHQQPYSIVNGIRVDGCHELTNNNNNNVDKISSASSSTPCSLSTNQSDSIFEDLRIIDSSLQFINDLLRNMLDVQRAACHELKIENRPTDILQDIFEPVDAMLYLRGRDVQVIVDCPPNLVVNTDHLRLKQIVMNLGRNAAKFVEKGFIKLRTRIVENRKYPSADIMSCTNGQQQENQSNSSVQIIIEDTGPGIPAHKKSTLFVKFQESLDTLAQGTGLGLSLCKILVDLMGGNVWLDDTYDSGIEGRPGSRFIIDLNTPPLLDAGGDDGPFDIESPPFRLSQNSSNGNKIARDLHDDDDDLVVEKCNIINHAMENMDACWAEKAVPKEQVCFLNSQQVRSSSTSSKTRTQKSTEERKRHQQDLPSSLSILCVDDDTVLRKLLVRALKRISKDWNIQEAASGEAALRLIDDNSSNQSSNTSVEHPCRCEDDDDYEASFDVIFMDQYMSGMSKQLLGTETTRALRSKGVRAKICGLSANEMPGDFFAAGADAFVCKPLPTNKEMIEEVLYEILFGGSLSSPPSTLPAKDNTTLVFLSSNYEKAQ